MGQRAPQKRELGARRSDEAYGCHKGQNAQYIRRVVDEEAYDGHGTT